MNIFLTHVTCMRNMGNERYAYVLGLHYVRTLITLYHSTEEAFYDRH